MEDAQTVEDIALETPVSDVFVPPSINDKAILSGDSYTYFSPVPPTLLPPSSPTKTTETPASGTPVCLGVDEAGRGPVLGPMVYGVFYLPIPLSDPLLRETHHFDDSKVLTPAVRSHLMTALCTAGSDLAETCGFAISALSARDISSGMMRPGANYNLNAQAMDATVELIKGVFAQGVNVQEIYVDTVGQPAAYQAKLQRFFPATKITVAKKADSLYPCVSAASVCAKVTRDAALEVLYKARAPDSAEEGMAWGSGYPSDGRCVSWMKSNMHPVFGWGPECRFSWGTAKDMLEGNGGLKVDWPVEDDGDTARMTDFFVSGDDDRDGDELGTWFGRPAGLEAF
ncbi:ribonuclease H2 subunit A [Colletotrichum tofieldiae]|uniref:Ribonuclease n=1 Tax=Colletotrichum tofieldiae TaxID=708197 RepID=A0A166YFH7_9PEZI|nr:ribonuclease H2 subunit A [Colletotrichum tofieldiae]GKT56962.1 ribonuclease H2 subunit A [Colletotrichum tofieldiae]GKT78694.1 ribonuclease H2 subunit A [Colletotrichum tofieldiae]